MPRRIRKTDSFSGIPFLGLLGRYSEDIIIRLVDKFDVSENNCWTWKRGKNKGYGAFRLKAPYVAARNYPAQRVTYALFCGSIPENTCVCHACDNPLCINPLHLFLGSKGDNNKDRAKKKRSSKLRGEQMHNSKLNTTAVVDILESEESNAALSRKYNVSERSIRAVRERVTWAHVPDPRGFNPFCADDPFVARLANEKGERD